MVNEKKSYRTQQKRDLLLVLKVILSLIVFVGYYIFVDFIRKKVYNNVLYFDPELSFCLAILSSAVFIAIPLLVQKNCIKWFAEHKVSCFIVCLICFLIVLSPFVFLKKGLMADETSIKKMDMFGNVSKEYHYVDIKEIDVSAGHGIEHEIKFKNNEHLFLSSSSGGINPYINDQNLMKFDKIISLYSSKKVTQDVGFIKTSNIKLFFNDKEVFDYFDNFFKKYYLKG